MKLGEYLLQKEVIVLSQLEDALVLQMDNPPIKLGEVLLSLGYISKSQLNETLKCYIKDTGRNVAEVSDWVTQEEADSLIKELLAER